MSPAMAASAEGPERASRRKARRSCSSGRAARTSSWCRRNRAATRPVPSGTRCSMSLRSMVASMGEAPPVPMAATTSPRSMTAGVVKSQSSGRSTTLTSTWAERAAPRRGLGEEVVIRGDEGEHCPRIGFRPRRPGRPSIRTTVAGELASSRALASAASPDPAMTMVLPLKGKRRGRRPRRRVQPKHGAAVTRPALRRQLSTVKIASDFTLREGSTPWPSTLDVNGNPWL